MDWISRQERQALKRIVALLLSLAALAELAGSKPRPLRAAVLWFLRPAESVARHFVMRLLEDFGGRSDLSVPLSADDVDDAMCLARSFRALAGLLGDLMRCGLASPSVRIGHPFRDLLTTLQNLAHAPAMLAPAQPDTS